MSIHLELRVSSRPWYTSSEATKHKMTASISGTPGAPGTGTWVKSAAMRLKITLNVVFILFYLKVAMPRVEELENGALR